MLAVTREMNGHCSTSSIILSCLTERPNSIFNGDASLTEEPRNRSSWYLPSKLQSFVCFPDVARPNRSRILPQSSVPWLQYTHNHIVRKKLATNQEKPHKQRKKSSCFDLIYAWHGFTFAAAENTYCNMPSMFWKFGDRSDTSWQV